MSFCEPKFRSNIIANSIRNTRRTGASGRHEEDPNSRRVLRWKNGRHGRWVRHLTSHEFILRRMLGLGRSWHNLNCTHIRDFRLMFSQNNVCSERFCGRSIGRCPSISSCYKIGSSHYHNWSHRWWPPVWIDIRSPQGWLSIIIQ